MEVHGIVAVDLNGAIGLQGKMPWHLSSELKHFKNLTMGYPIILGKTTFLSFKNPLPGREHLVLSTSLKMDKPEVKIFPSKEEVLKYCLKSNFSKIFICGGVSIYSQFKDEINIWHISKVDLKLEKADAFFDHAILKNFTIKSVHKNFDEKTKTNWSYEYYHRQ